MPHSFRGPLNNTGVSEYTISESRVHYDPYIIHVGGLIWGTPVSTHDSSHIFVGSSNRKFVCIDTKNRKIKWTYNLPTARADSLIDSAAAISPDETTVVVPGGDGALHALNTKSGSVLWQFCVHEDGHVIKGGYKEMEKLPQSSVTVPSFEGNVTFTSTGKLIIAGCDNGWCYCVNVDGTLKWRKYLGMMIWSVACILDDKYILIPSLNGNLYALELHNNGNIIAKINVGGGDIKASIAATSLSEIYATCSTGVVACLRLDTSKKQFSYVWKSNVHAEVYSSPSVFKQAGSNILIVNNMAGYVTAFDMNNKGKQIWRVRTYASIASSPLITANGYVIVTNSEGRVIIMNLYTGDIVGGNKLKEGKVLDLNATTEVTNIRTALNSSPILLSDGRLVSCSYSGDIYIYRPYVDRFSQSVIEFYDQNQSHLTRKSAVTSDIIVLALNIYDNAENKFAEVSIIKKIVSHNVQYNGIDISDAYDTFTCSDGLHMYLVPSKKWIELVSELRPTHLDITVTLEYSAKNLSDDGWMKRHIGVNKNKDTSTFHGSIKNVKLNKISSAYETPSKTGYDVKKLACDFPKILETYIPAALDASSFVMHFIGSESDSKQPKWLLLLPSLPGEDDTPNRVIRDTKKIILFKVDDYRNNTFRCTSTKTSIFSSMGGTLPIMGMTLIGNIDPVTKNIALSLYFKSSCLFIKCNGASYQFSDKVVNSLCDGRMGIHICASASAYVRRQPHKRTSVNTTPHQPIMVTWVDPETGVYSSSLNTNTNTNNKPPHALSTHCGCNAIQYQDVDVVGCVDSEENAVCFVPKRHWIERYSTDSLLMRSKVSRNITNICCKLGIHPNTITISGIVSSLISLVIGLYILKQNNSKKTKMKNKELLIALVIIFFAFKVLGDCFDGAVARACNKVSNLGGFLDGVSDMLFLMAVAWLMFSSVVTQISVYWGFIASLLVVLLWVIALLFIGGPIVMVDHTMMKENDSFLNKIFWLVIDNIVITSAMFIFIVAYLLHR